MKISKSEHPAGSLGAFLKDRKTALTSNASLEIFFKDSPDNNINTIVQGILKRLTTEITAFPEYLSVLQKKTPEDYVNLETFEIYERVKAYREMVVRAQTSPNFSKK